MLNTFEFTCEMAHRVEGFSHKEENIHGHSWKIEIGVEKTNQLDYEIVDMEEVRAACSEMVVGKYDRSLVLHEQDTMSDVTNLLRTRNLNIILLPVRPVVENIAEAIYDDIAGEVYKFNVQCVYVKVSEGSTKTATYVIGE